MNATVSCGNGKAVERADEPEDESIMHRQLLSRMKWRSPGRRQFFREAAKQNALA
jgi:hypothetical protein